MPAIVDIETLEDYEKAIAQPGVAVIDFWATWCGPCIAIAPAFKALAETDESEKVAYYKVDVDKVPEVTEKAGVRAMPTFLAYQNGTQVGSMKGAIPADLATMVRKFQE